MTSPRAEKIKIMNTILTFLERQTAPQSRQTLVSSLKLESGFTDKVIQDIINDLVTVKKVVANGDAIEIFR